MASVFNRIESNKPASISFRYFFFSRLELRIRVAEKGFSTIIYRPVSLVKRHVRSYVYDFIIDE